MVDAHLLHYHNQHNQPKLDYKLTCMSHITLTSNCVQLFNRKEQQQQQQKVALNF